MPESTSSAKVPKLGRRKRTNNDRPKPVKQQRLCIQESTSDQSDQEENQDSHEVAERDSSDEVSESDKPIDKRIQHTLQKYNGGTTIERDLWDTLHLLAYQNSQELSSYLVQWGRTGGIRHSRESFKSTEKIFDPTANSFTLWPLPIELCPIPDWFMEDELTALVSNMTRKMKQKKVLDDSLEDQENNQALIETLVDHNRETLHKLLNSLYEFHPTHSALTAVYTKTRSRSIRHKNDQDELVDQQDELAEEREKDFGLDWKFVLKVANSTLNLKENVLQQTHRRLCEIYRIPLENSQLDQDYNQQRTMNPVVSNHTSMSDQPMEDEAN